MAQNTHLLSYWFVTKESRAIATTKYQLKQLEIRLNKYLDLDGGIEFFPDEINSVCDLLTQRYLDYLKLIDIGNKYIDYELPAPDKTLNWQKKYCLIVELKQQLSRTTNLEHKINLIKEIASLYHHFNKLNRLPQASPLTSGEHITDLKKMFSTTDFPSWLISLVDFWNDTKDQPQKSSSLFQQWNHQEQQSALDFFSAPELVNLINAIFFYKLYPDKLFNELIHPEKLVSVQMRLSLLHHYIEELKNQLCTTALQHGLKPGIDYLFHGTELPQGIMIEVNESFRETIQLAIKELNVKYTPETEEQITIERLHDLVRAYKFWFNPNRLIDAVMVLQQRLLKEHIAQENQLEVFRQEMVVLYGQLTTTECLDLYGYFANNDSRYLLYILFTIAQGSPLDWLPSLNNIEKNAITKVFQALQCVMEALREELKNRHAATEPYLYDLAKQHIMAGRRNREAVFRIIAIYGSAAFTLNETVEQLFSFIEESN